MIYTTKYDSPIGILTLFSNGQELTEISFGKQNNISLNTSEICEECVLPIFEQTKQWLDIYFSGVSPNFTPPLSLDNLSPFRKRVCEIMLGINYGQTSTYGKIAKQIESERGKRVSAQAVGGAVGHNPIGIIIPCHRVIGTNGNLTGYAGGLDKKIELLKIEGLDVSKLKLPK